MLTFQSRFPFLVSNNCDTLFMAIKETAATKTTSRQHEQAAGRQRAGSGQQAAGSISNNIVKHEKVVAPPHTHTYTVKSLHVWTIWLKGRTLLLLPASPSLLLVAATVPSVYSANNSARAQLCVCCVLERERDRQRGRAAERERHTLERAESSI